jgi:hypothetical protein
LYIDLLGDPGQAFTCVLQGRAGPLRIRRGHRGPNRVRRGHRGPNRVRRGYSGPIRVRPVHGSCRGNRPGPSCRPNPDPRTHLDTTVGTDRAGRERQLQRPDRPVPSRRRQLLSRPYVRFPSSREGTHVFRCQTFWGASVLDLLHAAVRTVTCRPRLARSDDDLGSVASTRVATARVAST